MKSLYKTILAISIAIPLCHTLTKTLNWTGKRWRELTQCQHPEVPEYREELKEKLNTIENLKQTQKPIFCQMHVFGKKIALTAHECVLVSITILLTIKILL